MVHYLDQIAAFICRCKFEDFPFPVIQRAKEVVADTLAVIALGAQEEEVKRLTGKMAGPGRKKGAMVVGAGVRTEPIQAAFLNGAAGTFLEILEGSNYARGQPAIHALPAALAVAEEMNLSGREFLTAFLLGYEICARIGMACKLRLSMHPNGTWGTVGAAIAVGKLKGYGEQDMREMINVSSSLTLATSRRTMVEGGTVRNLYAGVSGHMGILCHDLIQAGFTGEMDGLQSVFGQVVSESFVPGVMTEDLGRRWEILRNFYKGYACGRYCQSVLEPLVSMIAGLPGGRMDPAEVARVEVTTYFWGAQLTEQNPRNTLAAKFSVPFTVATYIVNGSAGVDSFTARAMNDPAVKALAKRVTVREDSQMTALWPKSRPALVKVFLASGTVLEGRALTNKGDAEDPYTPEELRVKFFELADRVWNHETAEAIYGEALNLENLGNVNQLTNRMSST